MRKSDNAEVLRLQKKVLEMEGMMSLMKANYEAMEASYTATRTENAALQRIIRQVCTEWNTETLSAMREALGFGA